MFKLSFLNKGGGLVWLSLITIFIISAAVVILNIPKDEMVEDKNTEIKPTLSLQTYSDGKSTLLIPDEKHEHYFLFYRDTTGDGLANTTGHVSFNAWRGGFQIHDEVEVGAAVNISALYKRLKQVKYLNEKYPLEAINASSH